MDLKHLRYFVAAVEEGTLHAAAKKIGIAQPAISRRLKDLEATVGCELLVRNVRGVRPTRAGQALYQEALQILDKVTDAVQIAQRAGLVQGRETRLGVVQTARKYSFIHEALSAHAGRDADTGVAVSRNESHILANDLREDRLDMTILYEIHPGSARFETRLIHRERYLLAAHPSHGLAVPGPVHFDELSGEAFVWLLRRHGLESRDILRQNCRINGLDPLIGQIASSPEEIIDLVMVTGGICLTPASTAMTIPPDQLMFRTVPQLSLELDLNLSWNSQLRSSTAEAFLMRMNEAIDRHQIEIKESRASWSQLDGTMLFRTD